MINIGRYGIDIGNWFRFGGWLPWHEHRDQQRLYPHRRRPAWEHGWLHMSIGRWHWHFSWDRLHEGSIDYDAIP